MYLNVFIFAGGFGLQRSDLRGGGFGGSFRLFRSGRIFRRGFRLAEREDGHDRHGDKKDRRDAEKDLDQQTGSVTLRRGRAAGRLHIRLYRPKLLLRRIVLRRGGLLPVLRRGLLLRVRRRILRCILRGDDILHRLLRGRGGRPERGKLRSAVGAERGLVRKTGSTFRTEHNGLLLIGRNIDLM